MRKKWPTCDPFPRHYSAGNGSPVGHAFPSPLPPAEKVKEPRPVESRLTERTPITDGKESAKHAVGQTVSVWLAKSEAKVASAIQIGKPGEKPAPKDNKPGKAAPDAREKKSDTKREE